LGTFVKNQVDIAAGFLSGSSILFHWFSSLLLCEYYVNFIAVAVASIAFAIHRLPNEL
jgi:hypothetical protein